MRIMREREVRRYFLFLAGLVLLSFFAGILFWGRQMKQAKESFLLYERSVAGALLEAGVPEQTIVQALNADDGSGEGERLLTKIGLTERTKVRFFPVLPKVFRSTGKDLFLCLSFFSLLLFGVTALFCRKRERLYTDAASIIRRYMENDDAGRLPQLHEGALYEMFCAVDELFRIQRARHESEQNARQFLKETISDISHQLKTPLAALAMYQEIIADEPENSEAVRDFSVKMRAAITRMERLISSMLTLARLDTGNIVFERRRYQVSELVRLSLGELSTRAGEEGKELFVEGDERVMVDCDLEWTAEAVGNLVKNALDHTGTGGIVSVSWEAAPAMVRLYVKDDGCGIADEDIHHIFKRFYRSGRCRDTEGIGLGLPLAKAIVEGQDGVLSVESHPGEGTVFTVSFVTVHSVTSNRQPRHENSLREAGAAS